ncbi:MAG: hypothetical protein IPK32_09585 [Verrucomicrobiaceae bacterium]|nr:hypothetical protein [Verrucomicrobiaceae bacterium]
MITFDPPTIRNPVVPLGEVFLSLQVMKNLTDHDLGQALQSHQAGDWGVADPQVHLLNLQSLHEHADVVSRYRAINGRHFWVQTDFQKNETKVYLALD